MKQKLQRRFRARAFVMLGLGTVLFGGAILGPEAATADANNPCHRPGKPWTHNRPHHWAHPCDGDQRRHGGLLLPMSSVGKSVNLGGWSDEQESSDGQRRGGDRAVPRRASSAHPVHGPRPTPRATATALVLYDNTGPYGYLGELYAMATANLGGHFGTVKTLPISQYTAGLVNQYTATFYVGSTYYGGDVTDPTPPVFFTDVFNTTHPVTWLADNIWNMANSVGITQFEQKYGWNPTNSYLTDSNGSVGNVNQVTYKGQQLTRVIPAGQDGGVVRPDITGPAPVTQLAQATDASNGTTFPWAIRSSNMTYIGEIPFTYVSESNRVIALEDLLFDSLAPATPTRHRAMMRLEDISPDSDPTELRRMADYLYSQRIPYGINVIPRYRDPNGVYNNGVPEDVTLFDRPQVVSALKYMIQRGAVLMNHGYTHQYTNSAGVTKNNPYNGVTGDDFEFYLSHIDSNNNVLLDGTVPEDSTSYAQGRVDRARTEFQRAGLTFPRLWTTPHYSASATDYRVFGQNYGARLERSLYFSGTIGGATAVPNRFIGQFLPYVVQDVYGTKVLPENLGNYEPEAYNNHPPRLPADIINSARANLAVRDGFASFFYHPYFPVQPLRDIVNGIRNLGYTFVSPTTVLDAG